MIDSLIPKMRASVFVSVLLGFVFLAVVVAPEFGGDPARWALALMAMAFILASPDERPIQAPPWLGAAAFLAWLATSLHLADAPPLLLAGVGFCALALVARAGERALDYYLPAASNEEGLTLQRAIRREFVVGWCLFLVVFVLDGYEPFEASASRAVRTATLGLSAVYFLRWVLNQARYLGVTSRSAFTSQTLSRLVPAQRWPILTLSAVPILFGGLRSAESLRGLLEARAETTAILTCGLLLVLAAMSLLVSLVRLQKSRGWPRRSVRGASFVAGVMLSLGLAATLVELSPQLPPVGGAAITARAAAGVKTVYFSVAAVFLIALPFIRERTKLLSQYAKLEFFVPPIEIAILASPMAFSNGTRWGLASSQLWAFLMLDILIYYAWIAFRKRDTSRSYALAVPIVSLLLVWWGAQTQLPIVFKYFFSALGFVLYGFDLVGRSGPNENPIAESTG